MRLFFATDVHGSEVCWRKFLNAARHYHADTLVLGGDMTGKGLVTIVDAATASGARSCSNKPGCCAVRPRSRSMKLLHAGRITAPVGSTAVRGAIEQPQPVLSLHGHVHEARGFARIGRTLAINPGSSYGHGDLLGAVVDLSTTRKPRFALVDG